MLCAKVMQVPVDGRSASAGVDSGASGSTGFAPDSGIRGVSTPSGRSGVCFLRGFQASRVDSGLRVASQKIGPVAGEIARSAPQHTWWTERNR